MHQFGRAVLKLNTVPGGRLRCFGAEKQFLVNGAVVGVFLLLMVVTGRISAIKRVRIASGLLVCSVCLSMFPFSIP